MGALPSTCRTPATSSIASEAACGRRLRSKRGTGPRRWRIWATSWRAPGGRFDTTGSQRPWLTTRRPTSLSAVNTVPIGRGRQGFEMQTATRRSLLLSALAGAAVASPAKKYRVAVIGHTGRGNYGHGIDTVWNAFSQMEVVGVADPDEKGRAGALAAAKSFHLLFRVHLDKACDLVAQRLDECRPIGVIFHQLQACLTPASAQLAHRQQGRWQVHAGSHLLEEVSIGHPNQSKPLSSAAPAEAMGESSLT